MNRKIILVVMIILMMLLCSCSNKNDNNIKTIEEKISLINDSQEKINDAYNTMESPDYKGEIVSATLISLDANIECLKIYFENISDEYELITDEEYKQKALSIIEDKVPQSSYDELLEYDSFDSSKINQNILDIFE